MRYPLVRVVGWILANNSGFDYPVDPVEAVSIKQ